MSWFINDQELPYFIFLQQTGMGVKQASRTVIVQMGSQNSRLWFCILTMCSLGLSPKKRGFSGHAAHFQHLVAGKCLEYSKCLRDENSSAVPTLKEARLANVTIRPRHSLFQLLWWLLDISGLVSSKICPLQSLIMVFCTLGYFLH